MRYWGVETAAVSTLQPSKKEEASACVYWDVTKVIPVNQPPIETDRLWGAGATLTNLHTRSVPDATSHPISWDEVRGGRQKSRQIPSGAR